MPIITPQQIYFYHVLPNLGQICLAISIILFIIVVLYVIVAFGDDDVNKVFVVVMLMVAFISCCLFVLIPDQETLIMMYASRYITVDNLNLGIQEIQKLIEYIVELVKS